MDIGVKAAYNACMNLFNEEIAKRIESQGICVEREVSARTLTTFGSGGFVHYVAYPVSVEQTLTFIEMAQGYRYHVVGAGSNLVISDYGLGCVLCLKRLKGYRFEGETLIASAGEFLPMLSKAAYEKGLSGLEFACGIPGTLGGALSMNAGAFGGELSQITEEIVLYKNGEVKKTTPKALGMRYRDGRLSGAVVLSATLRLTPKEKEAIRSTMEANTAAREKSQPKEQSAGCVFKRLNGVNPAVYVQGCGLKGVRIGGAAVSGKHCNFIVNLGGAESRDYLRLTERVKDKVRERYGVELEEEVVFLRD